MLSFINVTLSSNLLTSECVLLGQLFVRHDNIFLSVNVPTDKPPASHIFLLYV